MSTGAASCFSSSQSDFGKRALGRHSPSRLPRKDLLHSRSIRRRGLPGLSRLPEAAAIGEGGPTVLTFASEAMFAYLVTEDDKPPEDLCRNDNAVVDLQDSSGSLLQDRVILSADHELVAVDVSTAATDTFGSS